MELGYGGMLLGAAAVFIGGYARGYSGFGSAAIVMVLMTLIMPPHEVVPVAIMLEIAAGLGQVPGVRKHVDWRLLGMIMLGAAIGTPIGTKALLLMDPAPLRIGILSVILLICLTLLTGKRLADGRRWPVTLTAGIFSGVANGAAAIAGLPIALFLAAGQARAEIMRATLIVYISTIGIYTAILLARDCFYDMTTIYRTAAALPFLVAGLVLGGHRFGATSPQSFKRFTLVLLIALSIIGLMRAVQTHSGSG